MSFKKIILLLGALACANVNAETIDSYAATGTPGAANTTNTVCVKIPFIKRNSGTLVTGLTSAKLRPFEAVESSGTSTGTLVKRSFGFGYSLTATSPTGVYNLCLKPSAGFVWKRSGFFSHTYQVAGIILGATAADNGIFTVTLQ